jgi:hypothetical protein
MGTLGAGIISQGEAHDAWRRRKSDAGGRELFSGIHFAMDDWGNCS